MHRAEGAEEKTDAEAVARPEERRHHHEIEAGLTGEQQDIEKSPHQPICARCEPPGTNRPGRRTNLDQTGYREMD